MMAFQKGSTKVWVSVILVLAVAIGGYFFYQSLLAQNRMTLVLYIQDKEAAKTIDCRVTEKVAYEIPKTDAPADAALKILFKDELAQYGLYDSVIVADGVAKVMLDSANTPEGKPLGSLSSCEIGHLSSVLRDSLTQYQGIKYVELYSPEGKIEF